MATSDQHSPSADSNKMAYSVAPSRKTFGTVMTVLVTLCALLAALPLFSILFTVISQGFGRLDAATLTQLPPPPLVNGGGLRNAIVGTFTVLLIGSVLSVPFGIMAAIFVSEFARGTKFADAVRFGINVLSGVPSIIAGLFA